MGRRLQPAEREDIIRLITEGYGASAVAWLMSIPRSTVRDQVRRPAGVAQLAEATGLKPVQWGFESLHQHDHPAYAYLLGLYLGDGCISPVGRSLRLRIFLAKNQHAVIEECEEAIRVLRGRKPLRVDKGGCWEIASYWRAWPRLFPQHGPGRKHLRKIELARKQVEIVRAHPWWFLKGGIDSDGCRHRRIVRGKDYPAYSFKNFSQDILGIFARTCVLLGVHFTRSNFCTISIARRTDVARLDTEFSRMRLSSLGEG